MLAGMVLSEIRPSDVPCRYGGEEFLILLPGMSAAAALERAERLRTVFAATPVWMGDRPLYSTISIGLASSEGPVAQAEALVQRADTALYQAKDEGRNRVVVAQVEGGVLLIPSD